MPYPLFDITDPDTIELLKAIAAYVGTKNETGYAEAVKLGTLVTPVIPLDIIGQAKETTLQTASDILDLINSKTGNYIEASDNELLKDDTQVYMGMPPPVVYTKVMEISLIYDGIYRVICGGTIGAVGNNQAFYRIYLCIVF